MKNFVVGIISFALLISGGFANAGMIGNDRIVQAASAHSNSADHQAVSEFLSRAEVVEKLEAWGVAPAQATERVAQLTAEEARLLVENIDHDPAGAGALGILGAVFLVLLVLELVGVTDIFKRI